MSSSLLWLEVKQNTICIIYFHSCIFVPFDFPSPLWFINFFVKFFFFLELSAARRRAQMRDNWCHLVGVNFLDVLSAGDLLNSVKYSASLTFSSCGWHTWERPPPDRHCPQPIKSNDIFNCFGVLDESNSSGGMCLFLGEADRGKEREWESMQVRASNSEEINMM